MLAVTLKEAPSAVDLYPVKRKLSHYFLNFETIVMFTLWIFFIEKLIIIFLTNEPPFGDHHV